MPARLCTWQTAPMRRETDPHLDVALNRIGDRWTLLIIHALLAGSRKFNELMGDVDGIAPNILTKRLRQLEIDALIVVTPYSQKPVRFSYTLTEPGRELAAALNSLSAWGAKQSGDVRPGARHRTCGTTVEVRPWCPTCNTWVDAEALDEQLDWV
jgi:DNA-binding HxlR family transcriptional regulator